MKTGTKGVLAYLVITFGLAWVIWTIVILAGIRPDSGEVFQRAILPGAFAPAIAAIIVRKWITREGFGDAGLRLNLQKWPYYLLAWFLPLLVMIAVVLLAVSFNISSPDFTLQRGYPSLSGGRPAPEGASFTAILLRFVITVPFMTPVLWGEEFGWRGYLQIRLFADRPTLAAVLTGLIWSVWHLPVNLIGYNDIGNLGFGMVLFTIGTMMTSVIFGWFQERTGSNWAASLAHAANNGLGGTLAMLLFQGGENYSWVSYGGILSLVPLGLFCAWIVVSRQASQPRYRKILEKVQG